MEKRFIVTNHEYLNTGGGCMASVFTVYDSTDNVVRYVCTNDEGFNWQTVDTVTNVDFRCDISNELMDKIIIGHWQWDELTTEPCWDQHLFTDDEFELFKYCEFEFYKKDCMCFGTKVRLMANQLPNELYSKLSEDYIAWSNAEGVGCLTDGYDVFMDSSYEPPVMEDDVELQKLKIFRKWLLDLVSENTSEEKMQELYESYITITVAGHSIGLSFDAENYNNVLRVIDRAIEEF